MTDLTNFGPHDPICPAPHASDVCMCPWIAKARAEEREKVNESWQVEFDKEMAELHAKVKTLPIAHHYGGIQGWCVRIADVRNLIDGGGGVPTLQTLSDLRAKIETLPIWEDDRGWRVMSYLDVVALFDGGSDAPQ